MKHVSVLLFVLFAVWPAALVDDSGPPMADSSLLAAIRLVDEGTWTLSDESDPKLVFQTLAHDISYRDGLIYSGVGPGATVLAAPVYFGLRGLLREIPDYRVTNSRITGYYITNARALHRPIGKDFAALFGLQIAMTLVVLVPLFSSFLTRLHALLRASGVAAAPALVASVAAGGGSMALYYGSMYSRQAIAYLLVWHAVLWLVGRRPIDPVRSLAIGCLFGAAIATEYPSALLVVLVLLFQVGRLSRLQWLGLLIPLGGLLALLAAYHAALFGSVFATPYHYRFWYTPPALANLGIALEVFQPPSTLGLSMPSLSVMGQLCFGLFKGLFVYSPILGLGLLGHAVGLRRDLRGDSPSDSGVGSSRGWVTRWHVLSLVVFAAYLLYNASLGNHVPEHGHHFWGGLSTLWGPRYLFAVLPFLAWGVVRLDWRNRVIRVAIVLALSLSLANNLLGAMYSHVMMSSFAFGDDLQRPLGFAWSLLLERGPRFSLLDAQKVAPWIQVALLAVLTVLSGWLVSRVLRVERKVSGSRS